MAVRKRQLAALGQRAHKTIPFEVAFDKVNLLAPTKENSLATPPSATC